MFLKFLKRIAYLLLILVGGCAFSPPIPEQKWVPYPIRGVAFTQGGPAFFLIFENMETTCAHWEDKVACKKAWESLPRDYYPISKQEISFFADYGDGLQKIRWSKEALCATADSEATHDPNTCNRYWFLFSRRKLWEQI